MKESLEVWSKAWMAKALLINLVSRLPFDEQIHFLGQKLLGKHRLDAPDLLRRAVELFGLLRMAGGSVSNAAVLEIGTGWFPFVPLMSHLAGARRVLTVDVHRWLSLRNTQKAVAALACFADELAQKTGADPAAVGERYELMAALSEKATSLRGLLEGLGISYRCPCDITKSDLPAGSVDVVFTSNVLEHVPPDSLLAIHRETARLLWPGGFAVHRFNPGDHFEAFTGSSINFLKYSERQWRLLGGQGHSYHNRMRSREHAELIRQAPLAVAFWADSIDEAAVKALAAKELTVDERFRGIPDEYLCARYSWLVAANMDPADSITSPRSVEWIDEVLNECDQGHFRRPAVREARRT